MGKHIDFSIGATDPVEHRRLWFVLRAMAPRLTPDQIKSIDWLICLNEDGGLEVGRHFTLSCADCQTYDEITHPMAVAHSIANEHAGHHTVIGISNPIPSTADAEGTSQDLPVTGTVVSINSGRGGNTDTPRPFFKDTPPDNSEEGAPRNNPVATHDADSTRRSSTPRRTTGTTGSGHLPQSGPKERG